MWMFVWLLLLEMITKMLGKTNVNNYNEQVTFHLQKEAMRNGFHRDLKIGFYADSNIDLNSCAVLVKQLIPSNAYVDPYEILELVDRSDILVPLDVDVEKPAEDSQPMDALIYMTNVVEHVNQHFKYSTLLPIHIRYHSPGDNEFTSFTMPKTDVLLRCYTQPEAWSHDVAAPCDSANTSQCKWYKAPVQEMNALVITVPVGIRGHEQLVTVITLLVTTVGCLYLLTVILQHKGSKLKPH